MTPEMEQSLRAYIEQQRIVIQDLKDEIAALEYTARMRGGDRHHPPEAWTT